MHPRAVALVPCDRLAHPIGVAVGLPPGLHFFRRAHRHIQFVGQTHGRERDGVTHGHREPPPFIAGAVKVQHPRGPLGARLVPRLSDLRLPVAQGIGHVGTALERVAITTQCGAAFAAEQTPKTQIARVPVLVVAGIHAQQQTAFDALARHPVEHDHQPLRRHRMCALDRRYVAHRPAALRQRQPQLQIAHEPLGLEIGDALDGLTQHQGSAHLGLRRGCDQPQQRTPQSQEPGTCCVHMSRGQTGAAD